MSNPFGGEEKQGEDGESDLEALGVEFSLCDGLDAPLSGGLAAKATNFPNHVKIDDRAEEG